MQQQPEKLYTDPEICPKNPIPADMNRPWFINLWFYDVYQAKWIQKPQKKGINKFKTFKERLAEAQALKQVLREELEKGWNPLTGEYQQPVNDPLAEIDKMSDMPFKKAIDFAFSKCTGSPRTIINYKNSYKRIMSQATCVSIPGYDKVFDFSQIPISQISKKHIRFLLDHCKQKLKWSNKGFNKHMGYYRAIVGQLQKAEIIPHNPASGIKELPVNETQKFIPYTEQEKAKIYEHLFLNSYVSLFLQWSYTTPVCDLMRF